MQVGAEVAEFAARAHWPAVSGRLATVSRAVPVVTDDRKLTREDLFRVGL